MSQSQNPIWEYFCKLYDNASKAKCCQCNKLLLVSSKKLPKQTVHGVKLSSGKVKKELYASYLKKNFSIQKFTASKIFRFIVRFRPKKGVFFVYFSAENLFSIFGGYIFRQ